MGLSIFCAAQKPRRSGGQVVGGLNLFFSFIVTSISRSRLRLCAVVARSPDGLAERTPEPHCVRLYPDARPSFPSWQQLRGSGWT